MPNLFKRTILPLSLLGITGACSSVSKAPYQVVFDQDVTVVSENDQEKPVKQGDSVDLTDSPLTVRRNGSSPLIVLPLPKEKGIINLKLPRDGSDKEKGNAEASEKGLSPSTDVDVNRLAQNILWIQNLLIENRPDDALAKIQDIRDRFKNLSYIRFLEASAYLAKGQVGKAQEICEAALKDYPEDEVGKAFLKQLSLLTGSANNAQERSP